MLVYNQVFIPIVWFFSGLSLGIPMGWFIHKKGIQSTTIVNIIIFVLGIASITKDVFFLDSPQTPMPVYLLLGGVTATINTNFAQAIHDIVEYMRK